MKQQLPRYMIMILLIFQEDSGDMDDYRNAIGMLPENLPEEERDAMKEVIKKYIGIKEMSDDDIPFATEPMVETRR